jgi:hypothetical protein
MSRKLFTVFAALTIALLPAVAMGQAHTSDPPRAAPGEHIPYSKKGPQRCHEPSLLLSPCSAQNTNFNPNCIMRGSPWFA